MCIFSIIISLLCPLRASASPALQSSTPYTPASAFPSLGATFAPQTTGPARVAGLDTLLTAAGVDNEEDADFLHPLGSAAAFPGPAAPSLKCRRDSPPGFYVTITATAAATTTCPVSPMATTIALYHGSGSPFGLIVRCSSDLGAPDELLEYDGHQCCMISAA